MQYAKELKTLSKMLNDAAVAVLSVEEAKAEWVKPEYRTFDTPRGRVYLVRKDGTVVPGLKRFQQAALDALELDRIKLLSKMEGLRWQIAQLGKEAACR